MFALQNPPTDAILIGFALVASPWIIGALVLGAVLNWLFKS